MTTRTRKTPESPQSTLGKLRAVRATGDTRKTTTTAAGRARAVDALRALYVSVKSARITKDEAELAAKDAGREAVALAVAEGLTDHPITFDVGGDLYVGTIVSPQGSAKWDAEAVVDYLHTSGKWETCSTRVFDAEKWEAEVTSGNIPPRTANRFKIPGTPGTPYVKTVKK